MSYLADGVYYEFIALACNARYTMPLGLKWSKRPVFRVYRGSGLYNILRDGKEEQLLLYAPLDPIDFYDSLMHRLDSELTGCAPPRDFIVYVSCTPKLLLSNQEYDLYECGNAEVVPGKPVPYTRVYGCLTELLIILTKLEAQVIPGSKALEYAENLANCVKRASPDKRVYWGVADEVLQRISELSQENL
ncbi:MAG: hypothetical protein F7B95_01840 [Desulfurococcales archaeon]|nr:hypothetical protein [Desulfurococcales archaeon]